VPHGFLLSAHSALGIDIGGDQITGFENAVGGSNDDSIYGSRGANRLDGGDGTDNLFGFNGRDTLTGGGDDDIFHFTQLSDSGLKSSTRDVITDFSQGEGDKIHLSAIDANGSAAGEGIFNFIGTDPFSHARGELRESYSNGNTIVSGDVNGDGKADFSITLTGHITLLAGDFNL
jgi:Ca2+-binding RTX toxin-like protein